MKATNNYIINQTLAAVGEFGSTYRSDESQCYLNYIREAVQQNQVLEELRGRQINRFLDEVSRLNLLANKYANKLEDLALLFKDEEVKG